MERNRRPSRSARPILQKNSKLAFGLCAAVFVLVVASSAAAWTISKRHHDATSPNPSKRQSATTTHDVGKAPVAAFNKTTHSLTDPTSIWLIVNKPHALNPIDYRPTDLVTPDVPLRVPGNESMQLRKQTASALEQLFADAKANGLNLMLSSGYRSYSYQVGLYNGYVKSMGQAAADKSSARPGHSEHQTGLAADVEPTTKKCELDACFFDTPEGAWVTANAYKYGFIIRYTKDKQAITGYEYEPWHLRYVGVELAMEMHTKGIETLEEFFGVSGGATYN